MSNLVNLFGSEYSTDGHYLQYIDSYPSLIMIKDVPQFLEELSKIHNDDRVTDFAIGGLLDNEKAIKNVSSIKEKLDYTPGVLDDYLDVLLYYHKNGADNKFLLHPEDYDLLQSMNGTLESYLIGGMNNSNELYKKIITNYFASTEIPAHFHNISYWLKRRDCPNGDKPHSVWNILSNEYRSYCLGKR